MDPVAVFVFMKDSLKEWNYPSIHAMNDAQIADLFSSSNRTFLVCWLLKRLYPDQFHENENYSTQVLTNFLNNVGFCTKKQGEVLFQSEFHEDQASTLYRMFVFAKRVSEQTMRVIKQPVSKINSACIDELNNLSVNLFPCYGALKLLTNNQRTELRETCEKDLTHVEEILKSGNDDKEINNIHNCIASYKEDTEIIVKEMKRYLPEFSRIVRDIPMNSERISKEQTNRDVDVCEKIDRMAANMEKLRRNFEGLHTLLEFTECNDTSSTDLSVPQGKQPFTLLSDLVEETQDIKRMINTMDSKVKHIK